MTSAAGGLRVLQTEHLAGLVVRVSTDHQARNDEGSLKTQLQRLREHLRYKTEAVGESWTEVAVYELRGVSGKNSVRSREFERLFDDIRSGRVNTVVCTSLDRICRSVVDFLHFFEFLAEHDAQFVCLKQQYDTTSPQGRLFVTIMMALAQFEREQTAERTRDATAARAERGLWNGGRLLGYDLDAAHKGYLTVNRDEAALVNFAFTTYLATGSIGDTVTALNSRGYRTKRFTSRRDVEHAPRPFAYTSVQHLLKNPAYVGRKVIDARGERRFVDAVWPAIVDTETFDHAQRLLALNGRTNRSQAKAVRHVHVLSGLLACGRCGTPMQGRSGTGRQGKTYFYYACPSKDCGLRAVAAEVEDAVIQRVGVLASDEQTVEKITGRANAVLSRQRPELEKRLRALQRSRRVLDGEGDRVVRGLARATTETAVLLNRKLSEIAARRQELNSAVLEAEGELKAIERAAVDTGEVLVGLQNFGRVFACLQPHEQRELVRLAVKRAVLGDRELVLELYGNACASFAGDEKANPSAGFAAAPIWLPGSLAQSVLRDTFEVLLPSLTTRKRREIRRRRQGVRPSLADRWLIADVESKAEFARLAGVSRARMTQATRPTAAFAG